MEHEGVTYNVTAIGAEAFRYFKGKEITLPEGIVTIGDNAFYGCESTFLAIPSTVTTIGDWSFNSCKSSNMVLPEGLTTIGEGAFASCQNYTSLTIPNSVTSIGKSAFRQNTKLTSIAIGTGVTAINDETFCKCSNVVNLTIGENVKTIGASAFAEINSVLRQVTLPQELTTIGDLAFSGCSELRDIEIPASVTEIGVAPFASCAMTAINVATDNAVYASANGLLCDKEVSTLFECPGGATELDLPASVTTLATKCLYGCAKLEELVIPATVTTIEPGCAEGSKITKLVTEGLKEIPQSAFSGCTTPQEFVLGEGLEKIGPSAFQGCQRLTGFNFPSSLTEIGASAFETCGGTQFDWGSMSVIAFGPTSLVIPDNVTTVGDRAFLGCAGLKTIEIGSGLANLGEDAFDAESSLESYAVSEDNAAFASLNGVLYDKGMTTILQEPCALTEIPELAETATKIGAKAFKGCALKAVDLPKQIREIGTRAFDGCTSVETFTLWQNVKTIGAGAFMRCSGVKKFYSYPIVPPTLEGGDVFSGLKTESTCYLYVPQGYKAAYQAVDQWKDFKVMMDKLEVIEPDSESETAIEGVDAGCASPAVYYDLTGRRVANPESGVYVKVQNGKALKVRI